MLVHGINTLLLLSGSLVGGTQARPLVMSSPLSSFFAAAAAAAAAEWTPLKDAAKITNPEIAPHLFAKGRLLPDGRGVVIRAVVVVGC